MAYEGLVPYRREMVYWCELTELFIAPIFQVGSEYNYKSVVESLYGKVRNKNGFQLECCVT